MQAAIPRIRAHLADKVIPDVKGIFNDIREKKKHHDYIDENTFK